MLINVRYFIFHTGILLTTVPFTFNLIMSRCKDYDYRKKTKKSSTREKVPTVPPGTHEVAVLNRFDSEYYYLSILLPIVAGILHFRVFLTSLCILTSTRSLSTVDVQNKLINLDKVVVSAYTFDLFCCYVGQVIPFSRCNSAWDVAAHHLPILLVFVPLNLPMYCERFMHLDPLSSDIMGSSLDGEFREAFIDAGLRSYGWGFISSLNESFMCLQRAEMSARGLKVFREISDSTSQKMKHKCRIIFTSRFTIALELYFKLGVFCIFSLCGFRACCDLDVVMFRYTTKSIRGLALLD